MNVEMDAYIYTYIYVEHVGDGDTSCVWCARKIPKGLVKRLDDLEIR